MGEIDYNAKENEIRERILTILEARGMTQTEFSKRLGLSKTMANKMLVRKLHVQAYHIPMMCEVLGVSPEVLLCMKNF